MKRKVFLCVVLCLALFTAVAYKIHVYNCNANERIPSIHGIHNEEGVPVMVEDIKKQDYDVYDRISAVKKNGGTVKTYVTDYMRGMFKTGQEIKYICNDKTYKGKVTFVARQADINIGLYEVVIKLDNANACDQHIVHIKARVNRYKDVFVLPNETIITSDGILSVWKVEDSNAVLVPVKGIFSDGYNTIIQSGLSVGDKIVYRGESFLSDGAKVNIIGNNS